MGWWEGLAGEEQGGDPMAAIPLPRKEHAVQVLPCAVEPSPVSPSYKEEAVLALPVF